MTRRQIPARRLAWLREELAQWRADGIVDEAAATAIEARYEAGRRQAVATLTVTLGAVFVGVGLVSLVAANVDRLSPLTRFAGMAVVWFAAAVAAEWLAAGGRRGAAVGAAQVVAVTAYAATLFQAAQSLQVPAYEPTLLGLVAAGALVYAYACAGTAPLLAGVVAAGGWSVWEAGAAGGNAGTLFVALLATALAMAAVAALHEAGWRREFAVPWRDLSVLFALAGSFAAALPYGGAGVEFPTVVGVGLALALLVGVAGFGLGDRLSRLEVLALSALLVAGVGLRHWQPGGDGAGLGGDELLRALAGTACYLGAVVWFAVVGVLREQSWITHLATVALVLFVAVQSFGVFAPLLSGAALFLVLGVLLVAAGTLADRARRRLVEEVST